MNLNEQAKQVLVVEDEQEIRQLIALHLKREGFEVVECENGAEAISIVGSQSFDLIVLDWMLPGQSGLEITREIRNTQIQTPILFVTAKTEPEHLALALQAGADDFISKPFDTLVLIARAKALIRRHEWVTEGAKTQGSSLQIGGLKLNPEAVEAWVDENPVELTRSEFKLLETLMKNQGRVLSREDLISVIQGGGVNVVGRTIDTHVFGLRKKLGASAEFIETIRGVGYRISFQK